MWSFKPSGVIYCTLKAHSGIYSGSGDFPCKAAGLTCKPGLPLAPSRPLAAQKPSSVKSPPVQRRLVAVCVRVCVVNLYQHLYLCVCVCVCVEVLKSLGRVECTDSSFLMQITLMISCYNLHTFDKDELVIEDV